MRVLTIIKVIVPILLFAVLLGAIFYAQMPMMFLQEGWQTKRALYQHQDNSYDQVILQQRQVRNQGPETRIVRLEQIFLFERITEVDTTQLDRSEWRGL